MKKANKDDWVQIKSIELPKGERAPQIPLDTQACDLIKWVKGFIQHEAVLGDTVDVITITGRLERGTLVTIKPGYAHDYGRHVPELIYAQRQLLAFVCKGEQS